MARKALVKKRIILLLRKVTGEDILSHLKSIKRKLFITMFKTYPKELIKKYFLPVILPLIMVKKRSWLNVKNSFKQKHNRASYFCIRDEDVNDLVIFIKKEFPALKRERIEYSIQYSCSIAPPIEDLEKIIDSAKLYLTEVKYD